jgi:hypothetical protein
VTNLEWFKNLVDRARNHDLGAQLLLRETMKKVMDKAPVHSLTKMADWVAVEIWRDAEQDAVQQN